MTLRTRLTLLYTMLLSALLLVLALAVLTVMQTSLFNGVDADLRDTYGQYTNLAERLSIRPYSVTPTNSTETPLSFSEIRRTFPDYRVQFESLVGEDVTELTERASGSARDRQLLLSELRMTADQLRQTPTVDPNAPIHLTDAELLRLLRDPDHQILLTTPVKEVGLPPVSSRVLVTLTEFAYGRNFDGLTKTVATIVYFGRSLEATDQTLTTLRTIVLVIFLIGAGTAAAGAYLLAGQALRPLTMVKRAADRIGGQTLAVRVPEPQTGDEVQSLAHALNRMLDRLENSFEVQRRFTSDASHELRTPVTAIQGHASYLLRRSSPNEQQRESLTIIKNESERLTSLISSLLELARSDSGVLQLRRQPVLSLLLLQDIARELAPLAQAQGAELVTGGQDVALEGDPDRVKQVVINLVSNALKVGSLHIHLQSTPELEPPKNTPGTAARKGIPGVRISVQDDGPGIAPEHLERLFDRFYRVEESRSRDQGGAGLGLAIVRGIVDAHSGHIWIESEVGRGTTVNVWLPLGNIPDLDDDVA
ncbi:sensor histidine kinase [Deinococcus ruber]|uniref:histidine kinase n=1 Tax=Deinococcus ruber TaxID=1848197 RepID=A0A918F932_9DEIO|nr:HAMP domain-containing sensor histidine kinase [Deinococcus ruber]GGR12100.1 two-component sensor histidine kinase [Deinococcus ruber]